MSKAKKEQGYVDQAIDCAIGCSTCELMRVQSVHQWRQHILIRVRKYKTCGIGLFRVKVNASCDKYEKAK